MSKSRTWLQKRVPCPACEKRKAAIKALSRKFIINLKGKKA